MEIIFLIFAALMLGSSVSVVMARNQVYAAMSLVASFFFLAAIYALLGAHTIAILQVLVYAGAIVVLFLFVIMLLNIQEQPPLPLLESLSPMRLLAFAAVLGVGVVLVGVSLAATNEVRATVTQADRQPDGTYQVAFDHSPFIHGGYGTGALGTGEISMGPTDKLTFQVLQVHRVFSGSIQQATGDSVTIQGPQATLKLLAPGDLALQNGEGKDQELSRAVGQRARVTYRLDGSDPVAEKLQVLDGPPGPDLPLHDIAVTSYRGEPKIGQRVLLRPAMSLLRPEFGTVAALGSLLYGRYLLPFEVTSLLLLVAIVGAVVVAKGKI